MKNKQYKTIYPSIVPKGSIGTCIDVVHTYVQVFKSDIYLELVADDYELYDGYAELL